MGEAAFLAASMALRKTDVGSGSERAARTDGDLLRDLQVADIRVGADDVGHDVEDDCNPARGQIRLQRCPSGSWDLGICHAAGTQYPLLTSTFTVGRAGEVEFESALEGSKGRRGPGQAPRVRRVLDGRRTCRVVSRPSEHQEESSTRERAERASEQASRSWVLTFDKSPVPPKTTRPDFLRGLAP